MVKMILMKKWTIYPGMDEEKFVEDRPYPSNILRTYVYASRGKKGLFFRKLGVLCFFWKTWFKIHPFALLPAILLANQKKEILAHSMRLVE